MRQTYQTVDRKDSRALAQFLSREGQALLPMLDLIEQAEMAVDELIDVAGRATIEAVLTLSAQELAGPKHPGKRSGGASGWHGEPHAPRVAHEERHTPDQAIRGQMCLASRGAKVYSFAGFVGGRVAGRRLVHREPAIAPVLSPVRRCVSPAPRSSLPSDG